MDIKQQKSPNFNERGDGVVPGMLVLHYTGMKTADEAVARLCDAEAEVSAHYVVSENGNTLQLVDENKRAWHAGVAHWGGTDDVNSHSIGVEIVNPGHEFPLPGALGKLQPFPEMQISQVSALCKIIIDRWGIRADKVLAHSDIAPGRKVDPGHLFPWEALAREGVGLWECPVAMDYQAAEDLILNQDFVRDLLIGYGYDLQAEYGDVVRGFMRHFHPEKFVRWDDQPEPDVATIARLLALVRAKHELKA